MPHPSSFSPRSFTASGSNVTVNPACLHGFATAFNAALSRAVAAARMPSSSNLRTSTVAVSNVSSVVSTSGGEVAASPSFPAAGAGAGEASDAGTAAVAAMTPLELSFSSAAVYTTSTLGSVPAATAASTAAVVAATASTDPTPTPASCVPVPCPAERSGIQNHIRTPLPPPNFVAAASFFIGSVRIPPPVHRFALPLASRLDCSITAAAASFSAAP
mmetsp:Transcript_13827/g.49608  ORF Transcript_13827/g.49608 Transcript_13827/m.49608 type:complete len:217 (-) Transcript_13827:241-891(-)